MQNSPAPASDRVTTPKATTIAKVATDVLANFKRSFMLLCSHSLLSRPEFITILEVRALAGTRI